MTCLIRQCLTSFNIGFIIEWMLFSNILTSQSLCSIALCSFRLSSSQSRVVRGAIVSWIAPPAHLSHQPHCLWRDYQGCILSTEDRDQVYFHFSVPPVFSGHVPWHFMTSLALASLFLLHFTSSSFLGTHSSQFGESHSSGLRLISHFLRCSNLFSSFLYLKYVKYIFYIVEHVF